MGEMLVLCSSNWERAYVTDVLEVLAVPRGSVMHFRYLRKHVDPSLWDQLPLAKQATSPMEGQRLLIVYVCQREDRSGKKSWEAAYPVRLGILRECYKTGNAPHDLAFFYFDVQSYCAISDLACCRAEILDDMKAPNSDGDRFFAAVRPVASTGEVDAEDRSAFLSTVQGFDLRHFTSRDGSVSYLPAFLSIHTQGGRRTGYDGPMQQCFWELTEGETCRLDAILWLPKSPGPESVAVLKCNRDRFTTPELVSKAVASTYDEFVWGIAPAQVSTDTCTVISVATTLRFPGTACEVLNVDIPIHARIRFSRGYRLADVVSSVALPLAAALIGASGLLDRAGISDKDAVSAFVFAAASLFVVGALLSFVFRMRDVWNDLPRRAWEWWKHEVVTGDGDVQTGPSEEG